MATTTTTTTTMIQDIRNRNNHNNHSYSHTSHINHISHNNNNNKTTATSINDNDNNNNNHVMHMQDTLHNRLFLHDQRRICICTCNMQHAHAAGHAVYLPSPRLTPFASFRLATPNRMYLCMPIARANPNLTQSNPTYYRRSNRKSPRSL